MFSEQLRLIRKASGKTQRELAEHLQISAQSVSKWEKGEALPSIEYLPNMANFFGCSINAFFTDVESFDPKHNVYDISKIKSTLEIEEKINSALRHFKLNAEVKKIHHGVRILTFVVEMYEGVGITDIKKREKDLIHFISEENISFNTDDYKNNTFAIEIPKKDFNGVPLESALQSDEYVKSEHTLPIIMGYDRKDNLIIEDLARLPHMIVAGCPGSGKTTFVRNVIACLTSRFSAEELELIICDQIGEFAYAKDIPHTKGNILDTLQGTVDAMTRLADMAVLRYQRFTELGVRDIEGYNNVSDEKMSRIVVIVDEFADLMFLNREIESTVERIARKGRATGIHVIILSQRPSVNVFTGLIKASISSRACLHVETAAESKYIFDVAGAENLALDGDMLYNSNVTPGSNSKPVRVQVPYITESELVRKAKREKSDA